MSQTKGFVSYLCALVLQEHCFASFTLVSDFYTIVTATAAASLSTLS